MTIEFEAIEFPTPAEALQHTHASGWGVAIRLDGKDLVVSEADGDRLATAGVAFAYLCDHEGRILTVPVNA